MAIKDYSTSADGIETQFAANHVGHFLLTKLLMEKMLAGGKGARIINVSSQGYMSGGIRVDDYNFKVRKILRCSQYKRNLQKPAKTISSKTERRTLQPLARIRPIKDRKHSHGRPSCKIAKAQRRRRLRHHSRS